MLFEVRGARHAFAAAFTFVFAVPAAAQTPAVLVSNLQQTRADALVVDKDLGQSFIVGPHDVKLTHVEVSLEVGSAQEFTVQVDETELTGPTDLSAGWQNVRFEAPSGGLQLRAETTYYVILYVSSANGDWKVGRQNRDFTVRGANMKNLDSETQAQWGMGQSISRTSGDVFLPTVSKRLMIAVHGYRPLPAATNPPNPPPTPESARVVRDGLTVTFSEDLDTTSRPPGGAFAVRAAGRAISGTGPARLSGRTAKVSLSIPVAYGETVTVSYDRPPDDPLRGANGGAVASFADLRASNATLPVPPEAAFAVDVPCDSGLCRARTGEHVTFTDTSTGDYSRRSWDFFVVANRRPSGAVVRQAWSQPGFYEATLTVGGAGHESKAMRTFLVEAGSPAGTCEPDFQTICLRDSRYQVRATYAGPDGEARNAGVVRAGTNDSGLLRFGDFETWEVLVKLLDGCSINGADWVFLASATDLGFEVTVTDTATGEEWVHRNESGTPSPAVADSGAFPGACENR
ncbi:MAG: hypothetical protein F4210_08810 [Holophagales bacterium]|nr:hypothetical protein [Holophagales bacterium]MYF95596.1 hypothetical protein [Holophagales bacterium]